MTADLRQLVQQKIAEWREGAIEEARDRLPGWVGAQATLLKCADELADELDALCLDVPARSEEKKALAAVTAWFKEMDDPDGPFDVKSGTPLDIEAHIQKLERLRNEARAAVAAASSSSTADVPAPVGETEKE
jgi:hypothetical protein